MSFHYQNFPRGVDHEFTSLQCKSCGKIHVVPLYCGNRFCSVCSGSRMHRIRFRLKSLMDVAQLAKGEKYVHMILTVKSQDDPKAMCKFLQSCFRKFRSRKIFKTHYSGGAYVLELTHSESGWHAHLHVVLQGEFCPQPELLSAWRSISGAAGLFVKFIPKNAIVNYLTKYMCKIELTPILSKEAGETLKKLRLFTVFGLWHNLLPAWSKVPYECPSCGCCQWLPLMIYNDDNSRQEMTALQNRFGAG